MFISYLEASSGTILGHNANVWWINACPDKRVEIIMSEISHLKQVNSYIRYKS